MKILRRRLQNIFKLSPSYKRQHISGLVIRNTFVVNAIIGVFTLLLLQPNLAWSQEKKSGEEPAEQTPCEKFEDIFSEKSGSYRKVSSMNLEDPRVRMSLSPFSFYKKGKNLYGLLILHKNSQQYMGLIQFYPKVNLVILTEQGSNKEYLPSEIEDFRSSAEDISRVRWESELLSMPQMRDISCYPLAGTVPGEQFEDGRPRKFIRRFFFGKRDSIGRSEYLGCDTWRHYSEQFRFYETFLPYRFDIDGKHIYVDNDYAGAATATGDFKYICNVGDVIRGRIITVDKVEKEPVSTADFLASRGFKDVEDGYFYAGHQWELQVLRNIIEGQNLFHEPLKGKQ